MSLSRRAVLAGLCTAPLAGCSGPGATNGSTSTDAALPASPETRSVPANGPYGFTHLRANGNRVLEGTGTLPNTEPRLIEVDFEPSWVVGLPDRSGSAWAVVGTSGRTAAFRVRNDRTDPMPIEPGRLPSGVPPFAALAEGRVRLLPPPTAGASTLTHPLPVGSGRLLFVEDDGSVALWEDGVVDRLQVAALRDARIVRIYADTYAILSGATTRYRHGALGDDTEAGQLTVFEVSDGLLSRSQVNSAEGVVVEGQLPIATPLDPETGPLLIVTLTDASSGARVAAFDRDGERIATGPAIGTGFRWRHQLCVAPFGPDGELELAVVRTPHIGGVVEFYRRRDDRLEIVATRDGFSSHAFGSRNLDGGVAGDLDGDGAVELLVPIQDRRALVGIRRTVDGTQPAWRLPLGGALSTNVAGTSTAGGRAAVAAGRADGTVLVWQ